MATVAGVSPGARTSAIYNLLAMGYFIPLHQVDILEQLKKLEEEKKKIEDKINELEAPPQTDEKEGQKIVLLGQIKKTAEKIERLKQEATSFSAKTGEEIRDGNKVFFNKYDIFLNAQKNYASLSDKLTGLYLHSTSAVRFIKAYAEYLKEKNADQELAELLKRLGIDDINKIHNVERKIIKAVEEDIVQERNELGSEFRALREERDKTFKAYTAALEALKPLDANGTPVAPTPAAAAGAAGEQPQPFKVFVEGLKELLEEDKKYFSYFVAPNTYVDEDDFEKLKRHHEQVRKKVLELMGENIASAEEIMKKLVEDFKKREEEIQFRLTHPGTGLQLSTARNFFSIPEATWKLGLEKDEAPDLYFDHFIHPDDYMGATQVSKWQLTPGEVSYVNNPFLSALDPIRWKGDVIRFEAPKEGQVKFFIGGRATPAARGAALCLTILQLASMRNPNKLSDYTLAVDCHPEEAEVVALIASLLNYKPDQVEGDESQKRVKKEAFKDAFVKIEKLSRDEKLALLRQHLGHSAMADEIFNSLDVRLQRKALNRINAEAIVVEDTNFDNFSALSKEDQLKGFARATPKQAFKILSKAFQPTAQPTKKELLETLPWKEQAIVIHKILQKLSAAKVAPAGQQISTASSQWKWTSAELEGLLEDFPADQVLKIIDYIELETKELANLLASLPKTVLGSIIFSIPPIEQKEKIPAIITILSSANVSQDLKTQLFNHLFSAVNWEGIDAILKKLKPEQLKENLKDLLTKPGTDEGLIHKIWENTDPKILREILREAKIDDTILIQCITHFFGLEVNEKVVVRRVLLADLVLSPNKLDDIFGKLQDNEVKKQFIYTLILSKNPLVTQQMLVDLMKNAQFSLEQTRDILEKIGRIRDLGFLEKVVKALPDDATRAEAIALLATIIEYDRFVQSPAAQYRLKQLIPDFPGVGAKVKEVLDDLYPNASDSNKKEEAIKVLVLVRPDLDATLRLPPAQPASPAP